MRIHWLQHVEFEGLGLIEDWVAEKAYELNRTRLFKGETPPSPADVDMLVIMGGPMNIHDEQEYPWLATEKSFIRQCIADGKTILGICLGAQLLADVLGGEVKPSGIKEIGWFEITRYAGLPASLEEILPEKLTVLHWHGDTFAIPEGALPIYSSAACQNQGFVHNERLVGLQFHLEITGRELPALIKACREELEEGRWVQREEALLQGARDNTATPEVLFALLDYLALLAG